MARDLKATLTAKMWREMTSQHGRAKMDELADWVEEHLAAMGEPLRMRYRAAPGEESVVVKELTITSGHLIMRLQTVITVARNQQQKIIQDGWEIRRTPLLRDPPVWVQAPVLLSLVRPLPGPRSGGAARSAEP